MSAARALLPEAIVLRAVDAYGGPGTPTYVIRNRICQETLARPTVADVRKVLNRLEGFGRVQRTIATRPNQVMWEIVPKRLPTTPSLLTSRREAKRRADKQRTHEALPRRIDPLGGLARHPRTDHREGRRRL